MTYFSDLSYARTDDRLSLTNEIISGIKVIKMYVWEDAFTRLEDEARKY